MLNVIAQTTSNNATNAAQPATNNLFEIVTNLFSRPDMLAHPADMLPRLEAMGIVWAVVFLTVGLLCMFNGYKYYKVVVVFLAILIGLFAGYAVGQRMDATGTSSNAPYIVGGCCAALLAVLAMPLMKYAVAVIGGLVGAFVGANSWSAISIQTNNGQVTQISELYWIGALIGLILVGMLAFVLFKVAVELFTSVSGSTLAVMGAVALLLEVPAWKSTISNSIGTHAVIIPMLVIVPALIGVIHQQSRKDAAPAEA